MNWAGATSTTSTFAAVAAAAAAAAAAAVDGWWHLATVLVPGRSPLLRRRHVPSSRRRSEAKRRATEANGGCASANCRSPLLVPRVAPQREPTTKTNRMISLSLKWWHHSFRHVFKFQSIFRLTQSLPFIRCWQLTESLLFTFHRLCYETSCFFSIHFYKFLENCYQHF